MVLKPATTFNDQLRILKDRGLIIENEELAILVLNRISYYRLSAYLLPFRDTNGDDYKPNTKFENIVKIYEFDCRLRNLIMYAIEPIEIILRTQLAYFLAHEYGAIGYMDPENFKNPDWHCTFLKELQDAIDKNKKLPFVKHHIDCYAGNFPIWVGVEIFSFGMLSKLYSNLKTKDLKILAKYFNTGPEHLTSWLDCITNLRNRCAHYGRLYFHKIVKSPKMPNKGPIVRSERVFDILYIMKFLYPDENKWHNDIINSLEALITEYSETINLTYIGFPPNWINLLKINRDIECTLEWFDTNTTKQETASSAIHHLRLNQE